jgi:hypothetical protein
VCAGHGVLMEVDDNNALIVGDPLGILGQQLRPHLIHLSNNNNIISNTYENIY